MSAPHKHRDVIIAWANGADLQVKQRPYDEWKDISFPGWDANEYRIKPKIAKREGWVNIYQYELAEIDRKADLIHPTKESADALGASRKACIRIEWEEEV